MKILMYFAMVMVLLLMPVAGASESSDERIDELSTKVDKLSAELEVLTEALNTLVQKDRETAEEKQEEVVTPQDSAESEDGSADLIKAEVAAEQKQISELVRRIEEVVKTQKELSSELSELKNTNSPEPLYDENGKEVYLGVVEDDSESNAPVLEYYGNANESTPVYVYDNDDIYYEEPRRKSKVGISFYFGSRPRYYDYYDDWNGPWAITPPWWVRRQYYRRRHDW